MLTARLLGTPTFELDNQSVTHLLTGRPAALLIYLMVTNTPQPRTVLADLLWHNITEEQATSKLRYPLRDLRKVVGDYVIAKGDTIAFNQNLPHWIDAIAFTTHLSSIALGTSQVEPVILQELLNLYQGEFLAGFQIEDAPLFEQWRGAQHRHLQDLVVQGLQLRTQQHFAQGEYTPALAINHYLLTLEPWREETHQQRILLFAYSGQRSAALKQYTTCCQVLAEELDVLPMQQTTTLYEQIKSGEWFATQEVACKHQRLPISIAPFSQPQQPLVMPTKSAQQKELAPRFDLGAMPEPTYFYGRDAELALLHRRVGQDRCRLAAILGISGQGKTTLGAAFVQNLISEEQPSTGGFAQVIWRSLSNAPRCEEILHMWLQQLQEGEVAPLSLTLNQLITQLFVLLEERRCLLVLDDIDAIMATPTGEEVACSQEYHPGYEVYGHLFQLFFQRRHHSCLLIMGRRRPKVLTQLDERKGAFCLLKLDGLQSADSMSLLAAHGIVGDPCLQQQLHWGYSGNPFLLHRAANLIEELFGGAIVSFLEEGLYFLGDIGEIVAKQLAQLPQLEIQILYRLAQADQPLQPQDLWASLASLPSKAHFYLALQLLQRAFYLEQQENHLSISTPIATYLLEHGMLPGSSS